MITQFRPGADDVVFVTDLLDSASRPATDVLDHYLSRWGIEGIFQQGHRDIWSGGFDRLDTRGFIAAN